MDRTKTELPFDIFENILLRLPTKSLLRFKSVSKSWAATISDRFAAVHLRQSRKSSGNQDIFIWCESDGWIHDSRQLYGSRIPKHIKTKMYFDHLEQKLDDCVLFYCDGLALRRYLKINQKKYVLYNLSTRSYIEITCPHKIVYHSYKTVYGICYDPSANDYKVLIIDKNHYAVYYCTTKSWSEMKESPQDFRQLIMGRGVSLNGDLYFVLKTPEDRCQRMKIVGFDPTEEKFIKYPATRYVKTDCTFMYMTCLEGYLYLCFNDIYCQMIKVRGKADDYDDDDEEVTWMEVHARPPFSEPVYDDLCLYDQEDKAAVQLGRNQHKGYSILTGYQRVPYLENLFVISGPEKVIRKRGSA